MHSKCKKLFILGIMSNRRVALSEEDYKNKKFTTVDSVFDSSNEINEKIVYIKGINLVKQSFITPLPVTLYKKEFIHANRTEVIYLITNDLSLHGEDIYEIYKKRWKIEEYHKSIKQNAALSKSPTKKIVSQSNHIFASILGFVKLEKLKLKTGLNHYAIKYNALTRANQIIYKLMQRLFGKDRITVPV